MLMDDKRIVVAFGGNASYPPNIKGLAEEQFALIQVACEHLARLLEGGFKLVLTHGNGPVVGNILYRMAKTAHELAPMPMDICVAHSQGGMGYMLQQTLTNVLHEHEIDVKVSCLVTQVEVGADDPAFLKPSKPVGKFFTKREADAMAKETGWKFAEDSNRGYRRVVPSPIPLRILDTVAIEALIYAGIVPIAAGGGGIPVIRDIHGEFHGVPAVIDKDYTSALLANQIGAGTLVMLTGVERVALDFGKPSQRLLSEMTAADAARYMAEGQFPAGSMGPKIGAALKYLERGGRRVIITSLEHAFEALQGRAGTRIVR